MKRLSQIFQALLGVVALIFTALIALGRLTWRTIRNWWKNRSKWLRRSILAIFIIVPVGFVALVAYALHEGKYGRDYWDRKLSDNITLHSFSDNKWRVYNKQTGEYTTDKINWLSEVPKNDSLSVYALPHRRGYLNVKNGQIVIDATTNRYTKAWIFSEGLAAVEKEGKIGFINKQNEVVIPFHFDYSDLHTMCNLAYLFHNGYCVMTNAKGQLGLIDTRGNWVVEAQYSQIWAPQQQGYRTVIKENKYGMLDASLRLIYDPVYDYIGNFSDTGGFILMKDGRMWQEDYAGNVVTAFMYESSTQLYYPDGNGELQSSRYFRYKIAQRFGILDSFTGHPITPAIYDDIAMITSTLFEVSETDSYCCYLINTQGRIVE